MKKICPSCHQTKKFSEFNKNKNRKYGLQTYCRQCQCKYDKDYYRYIDKNKRAINVKARIKRIREWLESYKKMQCCFHCGNNDFRVLDFHHHKGNKIFNIAEATTHGYSVETLLSEIKKCQCLCSNCHRILTYLERRFIELRGLG